MRLAVWALSLVFLAGCATKPPQHLNQDALRASRPRMLMVAVDRSPPITSEGPAREGAPGLVVAGGAIGGLVGGLVVAGRDHTANQRRARWMKGCGSDDPVEEIRETLTEEFAKALSLEVAPTHRTKAKDPEDVIKDYPGADLILDIRTSRWGIHRIQAPSKSGKVHFAVGYDGSLRLIDARKRAVITETTCSIQYSNGDDPPTITELLENDCAMLDKGLMLTARTCAKRHAAALGLELDLDPDVE